MELAARERVRVAVHDRGLQSDLGEQLGYLLPPIAAPQAVAMQRPIERAADRRRELMA
ncbi:hypothetical protein BH23CHL8_BH23CHL8_26990 [soil metagenome]